MKQRKTPHKVLVFMLAFTLIFACACGTPGSSDTPTKTPSAKGNYLVIPLTSGNTSPISAMSYDLLNTVSTIQLYDTADYDILNECFAIIDRYEKIYRMLIEDTKDKLPNVKMILCEPFMLAESANENDIIKWTCYPGVKEYAATVKKLAKEYDLPFVALQDKLEQAAAGHADCYAFDGIHPTPAGAKMIATEWVKAFERVQK